MIENTEHRYKLREKFKIESGLDWVNKQGEPDLDYVNWLEGQIIATRSALGCCGNCHHRESMDNGNEFIEHCSNGNHMASWQRCDKWEYDNLKNKERRM